MYKIFFVEDETVIRKGIINTIDWKGLGFEVSGEAANGKEALKKLSKNHMPDVILTDVKMPLMDGLELTKTLKEQNYPVEIVILSGFAEFEYAKEAIKYNVFEYLLKPTNEDEFIKTFKKLKERLDQKRILEEKKNKTIIKLGKGLDKLKEDFLKDILELRTTSPYIINDRLDFLEIDISNKKHIIATFLIDGDMSKILDEWNNDITTLTLAYKNIISELLSSCDNQIIINNKREINILFSFKENENIMIGIHSAVESIIDKFNTLILDNNTRITAGVGSSYIELLETNKSYLQAKKALESRFYDKNKSIFVYENSCLDIDSSYYKYINGANEIIEKIISGKVMETDQFIEEFFNYCENEKIQPKIIKNYCKMFTMVFYNTVKENLEKIGSHDLLQINYDEDITNIEDIKELKNYIKHIFINYTKKINEVKDSNQVHYTKIINSAKKYIEDHYSQPISLEEISGHVFLSPTYFSFLFKSITGETYTGYLKKIRINKAKELLNNYDFKIYEISAMVGYSDYTYFTRQFKKSVGLSPKEYRIKEV